MPTWGYAIVAALVAVLAAYTLWPSNQVAGVPVFPPNLAEPFTISGNLGEQRVEGGRVRVAGLDRPADQMAVGGLAAALSSLRVDADRIVDGVDAQAARAWGVDGSRRLVFGNEERQWGEADGTAAVWDPARRRVHLLPAPTLAQVLAAAGRLDQRALLELPEGQPDWLAVDGVRLTVRDGQWRFPGDLRPAADGRVMRLLAALREVQFAVADAQADGAEAQHELRLPSLGGEERVRLLAAGDRAWLERDGSPPQPLVATEADTWRRHVASLREDRLLDPAFVGEPSAVVVSRAGAELFRLSQSGTWGEDGQRPWEVRWNAGAEPAARDAAQRIQQALLDIVVREPRPGEAPISPDATTLVVEYEFGTPITVVLGAGRAWAGGILSTPVEIPAVLRDLRADAFLDLRPCPFELSRIIKLQRRWPAEPQRDEVHARAAGGSWARTWPADAVPADPLAVGRLVRSLQRLTAKTVRLATPAERALPATAELAIRVAPVKVNMTGAEDEVELDDTVPQERSWRLSPQRDEDRLLPLGGPSWLMVDPLGGLAFTIDAADAEALLADVASTRLFPVAPSLVAAVEVGGEHGFRLERRGADWVLRQAGAERPADAVAARRLLRALAALDATGSVSAPGGTSGRVLVVETADGERITASVAVLPDGTVAALTERGGVRLDADAWSQVALDAAVYAPQAGERGTP